MVFIHLVGSLSGEIIRRFELEPTCSIDEVKAEIERLEGTPIEEQELLQDGSIISGAADIGAYGDNQDTVFLSLFRIDPRRLNAVAALAAGTAELDDLEEDLRNDYPVVLAAVRADGFSLQYASEALRRDHSIILAAIHETGLALRHAPSEAQKDRSLVLEAVRKHGLALEHAHTSLHADPELVLTALEERGRALQSKPEERRGAMRRILCNAGPLLQDRDFMIAAISLVPMAYECTDRLLLGDRALILMAVRHEPEVMCFTPVELRKDKNFMQQAIDVNAQAFRWAASHLQLDADLLSAAAPECLEALAILQGMSRNKIRCL